MNYNYKIKKYRFKNFVKISKQESKMVLKWRNHKKVRKWMDNNKTITLQQHEKFLKNLKTKKDSMYFLVSKNFQKIAVFTLNNIKNKKTKIGYIISPKIKNNAIFLEVIYYCLIFCFTHLKLNKIYGYSLKNNKSANFVNKQLHIKLQSYKSKYFYGYLSKKKWKTNVENNQKILNYLKLLK